jgi:transposase, IS30 family
MKYKHLNIKERELLQVMWWERRSMRYIARVLGRSHTSISRELKKNFPEEHEVYTPRLAEERAKINTRSRGRKDRLKSDAIRSYVITHLKRRWSPEQISIRIKIDLEECISHEAIYQYIYNQVHRDGYGYLKPEHEDLRSYLRRRRKRRVPKGTRRCQRVLKPYGTSIEERPDLINKRKRIGDWEGDTVESKDHRPGINTLVERKTGFVFITKLKDKTSDATIQAIKSRMETVPKKYKYTITLDNGPENKNWQKLEEEAELKTYYAHPYCSGERGTNENTNGLIRDYFPKKTDFGMISTEEIRFVERELNCRPRKRLAGKTPLEMMNGALTC